MVGKERAHYRQRDGVQDKQENVVLVRVIKPQPAGTVRRVVQQLSGQGGYRGYRGYQQQPVRRTFRWAPASPTPLIVTDAATS